MGEKKRRATRLPVAREAVAPWPSGFEIAGRKKPPGADAIDRDLIFFKKQFDAHPNYLSVLRALEFVGVARLHGVKWTPNVVITGSPEVQPEEGITVPWWALSALVGAVQKARNEKLSLDDVMGLSGDSRGKRGAFAEADATAEHAARALEVLYLMARDKIGKTHAIEQVAERHKISADAVRDSLTKAKALGLQVRAKPKAQSDRE